ncbi:MAG TPA: FKBP-type peptidyl-prolyl cis-trans isomerase [Candidatus Pacearchaeota archaeon]|nr:FKBP-type peptidyl-prolyl cis-trans isomerase [Candidatus Pacearchaeota archaeon]HRR94820.1 FKBP-type peptidyl-prolyl cis-trans isomerase [Candidatus Paceibacterota bacterium]HPC30578.1 FKBP-type peptidyl-prolyl cis-trans isomerase [Candidatus Pacearchaeota archaeon]HQG09322.1 FKBP-type peptidyl-prolyl cis-trans isomerase [Candidatus Pacearchaeota archaeon]HQH20204.1 FKBP-type peptidyl-prolyl cis-trans isomerase [Candidatus Pacearchaeota archaeon]
MKKNNIIIIAIVLIIIIGVAIYYFYRPKSIFAPEPIGVRGGEASANVVIGKEEQISDLINNFDNQSKMKIEILKQGSGVEVKSGDILTVNYTGTFIDGTKFDSSFNPGREPFIFKLGAGQVIKGWDEGLVGMKIGEQRRLTIPPEMGYGSAGVPGAIPPNATLIFVVDLLKIN